MNSILILMPGKPKLPEIVFIYSIRLFAVNQTQRGKGIFPGDSRELIRL